MSAHKRQLSGYTVFNEWFESRVESFPPENDTQWAYYWCAYDSWLAAEEHLLLRLEAYAKAKQKERKLQ